MDLIGFAALIEDDDDALATTQQLLPIDDLGEQRVVADAWREMRIVERAAQATFDTLRLGRAGQAQGGQFGGDLGEDGGFGGKDAGDEQGEALAGGMGQLPRSSGGPDALEHFLKDGAVGWHWSTSSARCSLLLRLRQEVFHARPG